jgi:hypothetical protein
MKRRDEVEDALDQLSALRAQPESESLLAALSSAIESRHSLVAAKAARIAIERSLLALAPAIAAAFEKLLLAPPKRDRGCAAQIAFADALCAFDHYAADSYLLGVRKVQMEPSWGPPIDAAAPLRARCAEGLVLTRHPEALYECVTLLADPVPDARRGAIRALTLHGSETALLLLHLKAATGDSDADALSECYAALAGAAPGRFLPLLESALGSPNEPAPEAAAFALASMRTEAALAALKRHWETGPGGPFAETLLLAIASMHIEPAFAFLLSLLESAPAPTARLALSALAIHRQDATVNAATEAALARREEPLRLQ